MASRVWRLTKLTFLSLLGIVLVLTGVAVAYRAYEHHRIAEATVIDAAKGIDEDRFVRIGGIDQWITFRGQDRGNPALLLLHGGPGVATSPYPRNVIFSWTKDFTLIQWDQRGAGKTFGRSGPIAPDVTIEQMVADGLEVAEFVRRKLHKQKIVLLGLSWGTILGIHMVKARPDLFSAYVGTGQMVNEQEGEAMAYSQVLDKARARSDHNAVKQLEAIGRPPYDSQEKLGVQRKWGRAYEPRAPSNWNLIWTVLFESPASFRDARDYMAGVVDSQNHFFGQNMSGSLNAVDLRTLGLDFGVPIFVFQGAEDDVAPVRLAQAYVNSMVAPQKQFVAIPGAGHTALNTKSDEFLTLLDRLVRPLAVESQVQGQLRLARHHDAAMVLCDAKRR